MLNILTESELAINDGIRSIFAAINNGIYSLIAITYNLIEDLANISVLSYGDMQKFASRIYALLGLFMLFKVSFSIITYILDPNKMADNSTGMSAIVKNTVITLILILTVPMAFNLLYEAQSAILEDNVIPKLILGNDQETTSTVTRNESTNSASADKNLQIYFSPEYCISQAPGHEGKTYPVLAKDTGNYISLLVLRPFFQPNPDLTPEEFLKRGNMIAERYCVPEASKVIDEINGKIPNGGEVAFNAWKAQVTLGTSLIADSLTTTIQDLLEGKPSAAELEAKYNQANENWWNGVMEVTPASYLGEEPIYNSANGADGLFQWSDYDIDFNYFMALIVGVFVELILIGIAFDVAVRSVKLAFLQLISPIPIVSYIDPKTGKDGMFKNWYREVFKTWASLFVRLIAVFFGVYLIQQINGSLYLVNDKEPLSGHLWIILFLLIGILMFMKQLPSLLETLIPGMKGSGSFNLNPFKKVADGAIGGKFLTGAAVGAGAMGIASIGGATANALAADKGNKMKNFGKGLFTGGYYGAKNGFQRGMNGKFNFGRAGYDAIKENSKFRNKTDDLAKAGVKGPFKLARQAIQDEYTDVIGKRGTAGTTSLIKNQIKEAQMNLANAQRDEQSASHAMEMMRTEKGGYKAGMYADAFKTSVQRDQEGNLHYVKENGENYREWMRGKISDKDNQMIDGWEKSIRETLSNQTGWADRSIEEQNQLVADRINDEISKRYGEANLTAEEYNSYNSLYEARNAADAAGRKYEKEIESKKELYEKAKGKNG